MSLSRTCAGTVAILHSFTLAQLTKRMSLTRKNEEAAANLQESKRLQLVYKESKELNLQEPKESERIKRIKRMQ